MSKMYLSGGVFFALLLTAKQTQKKKNSGGFGHADCMSAGNNLRSLLCVYHLAPQVVEKIDRVTVSKYKVCDINTPDFFGLDDEDKQKIFHDSVLQGASGTALNLMQQYVETYLNPSKYCHLIGLLLDVIEQDTDISDDDVFYITGNSIGTTKKDMLQQYDFYIAPFLLGVWDYIIMHRAHENKEGQEIYKAMFSSEAAHTRHQIVGGMACHHNANIVPFSLPTTVAPTTQPPQPAQQGDSQSPSCLLPPDKYFLIITTNRFADEFDTQTQSGGLMEYQIPAFNIDAKEFFAQKNPELLKAFETDPKGFLENLVGLPCIFSNYPEVGETIPDDGHYSPSPARMFDIGYLEKIGIEVGTYYTGKEVTTVLIEERRIEHTVRQCDIINHSTEFNFYHRKFIAPYKEGITLVECDLLGTLKELQLIP